MGKGQGGKKKGERRGWEREGGRVASWLLGMDAPENGLADV